MTTDTLQLFHPPTSPPNFCCSCQLYHPQITFTVFSLPLLRYNRLFCWAVADPAQFFFPRLCSPLVQIVCSLLVRVLESRLCWPGQQWRMWWSVWVAQKEEMGRGRQMGEMKRRQSLILPRFRAGRDQITSRLDWLEPWLRTSGICRVQKEVYFILWETILNKLLSEDYRI